MVCPLCKNHMLGHYVFLRRIVADSRSTWSLDTKTRWQAILVFAFTGKVCALFSLPNVQIWPLSECKMIKGRILKKGKVSYSLRQADVEDLLNIFDLYHLLADKSLWVLLSFFCECEQPVWLLVKNKDNLFGDGVSKLGRNVILINCCVLPVHPRLK